LDGVEGFTEATDVKGTGAGATGREDPLRVGLIAPPWVPVPPVHYGGTELVVDLLARGLRTAGCEVVLFTTGDAACPVPRRWLYPEALGTADAPAGERQHVEWAYATLGDVDVVHDHTEAGPAMTEAHDPAVPVVTTVHGRFTAPARALYASAATRGVAVVAISHAQRRAAPEVPVAAVIHHGVEPDDYPPGRGDGGYVLFLGRMSADKGAARAITIARAAGKRILLAAKMWEADELQYYAESVEPLLGDDAVFVGAVGGADKLVLLGGAEALVNPIRWPEPFGLVMIESLACGTPVLSFPEGAAPEIVKPGRTGFLCADEDEMVSKLALVGHLDRATCRASVQERFSATRMVSDHLRLYRRLVRDRRLATRALAAPAGTT
jgi:glycosyltransferase involved in cell wall biosynthesis